MTHPILTHDSSDPHDSPDDYAEDASQGLSFALPAALAAKLPADVRRWALWLELLLLFVGTPLLVVTGLFPKRLIMLLLATGTAYAIAVARRGGATREQLGMGPAGLSAAPRCARVGLTLWAAAFLATAGAHLALGRRVFPLVADAPGLFALIGVVYLASVAAQEFLFRSWFFWRYRALLSPGALVAVNALAFAWVHVVYGSWLSVSLTLAGGLLFALLFRRYRSLLGVCLVHAAFGLSLFAMGYGRYFYHGTDLVAQQLRHAAP